MSSGAGAAQPRDPGLLTVVPALGFEPGADLLVGLIEVDRACRLDVLAPEQMEADLGLQHTADLTGLEREERASSSGYSRPRGRAPRRPSSSAVGHSE